METIILTLWISAQIMIFYSNSRYKMNIKKTIIICVSITIPFISYWLLDCSIYFVFYWLSVCINQTIPHIDSGCYCCFDTI